ncbi:MAG TPA: LamG domain-containing protein, partial [Polyangiaceae bacterium]|nr:LamG domain-containing protein [Polyangiaceae bacterium]
MLLSSARIARGAPGEGLLFYVSGEHGARADVAASGEREPTFLRDVHEIADGARGPALSCAGTQLLAYRAPGNIYAERGTLAFSWRSREPVGPTAFPIFRVGYGDHSSWDMVWLRIDYNGRGGFDAFVTDVNLARVRVSTSLAVFPRPQQWVHLAFTWDETNGVELYVDGHRVAQKAAQPMLDAALDQFGPHSRIISPYQVQSDYNFVRGGDIDELRIYDRRLSPDNIAALAARRGIPSSVPSRERSVARGSWRDVWWRRNGWNRAGDAPPYLSAEQTSVRKVEIHDVRDHGRWWWKATDGIAETTWPGVYNRSRLPGRNDYFQLPDWDCYSVSGQSVSFTLPDEPLNQIEIAGSAWGTMWLDGENAGQGSLLFERAEGEQRTVHRLGSPLRSPQKLRFENVEREEPIGELSAYQVTAGGPPAGDTLLAYTLDAAPASGAFAPGTGVDPSVALARRFINGRFPPDERALLIARPTLGAAPSARGRAAPPAPGRPLPLVHVVIPAQSFERDAAIDGLDGIAIELPALKVAATHADLLPLRVQVKDPLWLHRNLLDFSFSVRPGEARRLWLDTRDRLLPRDRPLYLTLAAASAGFGAETLRGARLALYFEPRARAQAEHELDRFTQLRDSYAMLVEERPRDPRFELYNRFAGDVGDLLRVNPKHFLAQAYWFDSDRRHPKPHVVLPEPPPNVPLWAFRQVKQLENVERFVSYYIGQRQLDNGEFGGGLSDDGDLTNQWPGAALMGIDPERVQRSLRRELEAFYEQGMLTDGLPTIQADELHGYEEGLQALAQAMLLDHGDPLLLERAMQTARGLQRISAKNAAGHRHLRSSYFSATKLAEDEPWGGSREYSYLITHPVLSLIDFNGSPAAKALIIELADGLLAHRRADDAGGFRLHPSVRFASDEDEASPSDTVLPLFWAVWRWTGDPKYLLPFRDIGARAFERAPVSALGLDALRDLLPPPEALATEPVAGNEPSLHLAWQLTGNAEFLAALYGMQMEASQLREYINTEGSLWIDRVGVA